MTAARGLVRFISQYKFFFSFFFSFSFSLCLCTMGSAEEPIPSIVRCDHKAYRCLMPLRPVCNIRGEKEGKRKREKEAGEPAAKRSYDGFRAAGGFPPSFFPPRGSLFSHRSHRGSCTHRAPTSNISLRSSFYYHYCYYNFVADESTRGPA